MALMALEQLHGAAKLIRSHRECFDGTGYPDRLSGLAIPLGARILTLTKDYDNALMGTSFVKPMKPADAGLLIHDGKGKLYDPAVVDAFMSELVLRSDMIRPGMMLSRDLMSRNGEMLLAKEYVLNKQIIEQIRGVERMDGHPLSPPKLPPRAFQ